MNSLSVYLQCGRGQMFS